MNFILGFFVLDKMFIIFYDFCTLTLSFANRSPTVRKYYNFILNNGHLLRKLINFRLEFC